MAENADKVWLGTSWKMTKTIGEALAYVETLADRQLPDAVQTFLVPAHTALAAVRGRMPANSPVLLGAQNAHWAAEGAGTGEVSMRMVADAGARLVEIGHSERREHHNETDESVSLKVRAALDAALVPLVCVGEPLAIREAGGDREFVRAQVSAALSRLSPAEVCRVVLAYEPIWAIGERGRPATPEEVAPVIEEIREEVARASGGRGCRAVLYGGSVNLDNAAALLERTGADGLFVGRTAWDVHRFLKLVDIAADHSARRLRGGREERVDRPHAPNTPSGSVAKGL
ncbi:MAG TPA: triose-phosphate isomerase [Segeticoccus sp.]|uniref:triose-phosphate isomerase n=1 Tax=Segeticoccus sp. TaxID=2706531 RepID=UPI002D7EA5BB|nr:triose-phosphate isomerase [Segeticoccus sp.]HET8599822.1 triose-phosphate isomerase [Segeticoccus sp.]